MKRGSGACDAPRLNARRFEDLIVGNIRENILTEGNIRDLVRLVDEEMDGVAAEQRQRLETVESELAEVRRRLDRLYTLVETTDMEMDDSSPASETTGSAGRGWRPRRQRRGRCSRSAGRY